MRRTFCLLGTMYLLRCVCILITQLPVPETNVICDRKVKALYMINSALKKMREKKYIYQFDNGKIKDFTMYSTVLVT